MRFLNAQAFRGTAVYGILLNNNKIVYFLKFNRGRQIILSIEQEI
jgi:hypothetical protein